MPKEPRRWSGLKTIIKNDSKTVIVDWLPIKIVILLFVLAIIGILLVSFSAVINIRINDIPTHFNSSTEKMPSSTIILFNIAFVTILFLSFCPIRTKLIIDNKGDIIVNKRDWFFYTKKYFIKSEQKPELIAKKRKLNGNTLFLNKIPHYRLFLRLFEGSQKVDINLLFASAYFTRSEPIGALLEQEIRELKILGLKVVFEE
jgi:hypothetical protein